MNSSLRMRASSSVSAIFLLSKCLRMRLTSSMDIRNKGREMCEMDGKEVFPCVEMGKKWEFYANYG